MYTFGDDETSHRGSLVGTNTEGDEVQDGVRFTDKQNVNERKIIIDEEACENQEEYERRNKNSHFKLREVMMRITLGSYSTSVQFMMTSWFMNFLNTTWEMMTVLLHYHEARISPKAHCVYYGAMPLSENVSLAML